MNWECKWRSLNIQYLGTFFSDVAKDVNTKALLKKYVVWIARGKSQEPMVRNTAYLRSLQVTRNGRQKKSFVTILLEKFLERKLLCTCGHFHFGVIFCIEIRRPLLFGNRKQSLWKQRRFSCLVMSINLASFIICYNVVAM